MPRLIDANALIKKIDDYYNNSPFPHPGTPWRRGFEFCTELILNEPSVEEDHGYWIGRQLDNFRKYEVKCSECGWTGIENYDSYVDPSGFNYCPNCGAKMDGDGNG